MNFTTIKQKIKEILIWSQKYTKTDMIYLAKGGFWLTFKQVISSITSIILTIVFANFITKETYGTYKYILSIVSILAIFSLPGINTSLTRSVAIGQNGSINKIFFEKIKYGLIASFLSLLIATYYFIQNNFILGFCFIIPTLFIPFMESLNIYTSILQGKKKFKKISQYEIISQVIFSIIMIIVVIFSKNIFLILLTYFIINTILRFIFYKKTNEKKELEAEVENKIISYGKNLSLINLIEIIASQIDKILIWNFIGSSELAVYAIATGIPIQIESFFKNINTLAFPKLTTRSIFEIKKSLYKKICNFLILIIPIITIYYFLSPVIFKIFLPEYLESIPYTQIFILHLIFIPIGLINYIFIAKAMKKNIYISKISFSIIKIILLLVLLPKFGVWGAIIAILINSIFYTIINLLLLEKST